METSTQPSKRIRRHASRRAWERHSRTMHHLHMRMAARAGILRKQDLMVARALREVLGMWILYVLVMVITNKIGHQKTIVM